MSNEIEKLIDYRKLHEGIVREINRAPPADESRLKAASQSASKPEAAPVSADIASYLARVERAAQLLEQSRSHARDLEALVQDLQQRQIELENGFEELERRNKELEESSAAERNRATRAHSIASQATKRVQEMERALADANARADALTSAIEKAFGDVIDPSEAVAAA